MTPTPHYVTYALYDGELGHACDPTDFDGACDAYAERRDEGQEACVFRVEPPLPQGCKCGICIDVTADAEERIRNRYRQRRGYEMPVWLREVA